MSGGSDLETPSWNHIILNTVKDPPRLDPHGEIATTQSKATMHGLVYDKAVGQPNHWYGVMAPLLSFFVAFKARMAEARIMQVDVVVQMKEFEDKKVRLSSYRIKSWHVTLCEGMSFSPALRSSLAHSVGPSTVIMCLVLSPAFEDQYTSKWKSAFVRMFKNVPGHEMMPGLLIGSKRARSEMIELLCDIALFGVARPANRGYHPPIGFLIGYLRSFPDYVQFMYGDACPNCKLNVAYKIEDILQF